MQHISSDQPSMQKTGIPPARLREIVFGMEDGMVSTLGAITGIAIGTQDHYTVVLSGVVIIAVESISMGIGSYLANRSEREVHARMLREEAQEIADFPDAERTEMLHMFMRDGWPHDLALQMTEAAAQDKHLMLREMAFRELEVIPNSSVTPLVNALFMFGSYVVGGLVPLFAYFPLTVTQAMPISIVVALCGLFILGVGTSRLTGIRWWKAGLRILVLGGTALAIGLIVGEIGSRIQ